MNPYCFWLLRLDAKWPLNEGIHHWTTARGNNGILFSLLIDTWWRAWLQHATGFWDYINAGLSRLSCGLIGCFATDAPKETPVHPPHSHCIHLVPSIQSRRPSSHATSALTPSLVARPRHDSSTLCLHEALCTNVNKHSTVALELFYATLTSLAIFKSL